ncbi:hypothetical protein HPB47_012594 [Ixodes persulcatus]|uniref:Uncharacterized protein n=1 Tax=Ixodes persulcatus TaxID=34615 RepID=A0AC60NT33_IXOPE|nr:hypothetical protein HPB47_012594 [Ixodes persulcatus]
MPDDWVGFIQPLYDGNSVMSTFNGATSADVPVRRGLRQGCPLSPVVYMLYTSGMQRTLEQTGVGFTLQHKQHGRLPGLAFADDIVLMADSVPDIRLPLLACEAAGDRLQLQFNAIKSTVVQFPGQCEGPGSLTSHNNVLLVDTKYKYLGVTLTALEDYLAEHYTNLKASALRKRNVLRRRLWSSDRYAITRELWNAVAMPGLTFANAVTCDPSEIREYLERRQREIGRQALDSGRSNS